MPFPLLAAAAPLIGAGISAIGDIWTNRSAQRFAERMSSTSWQRAVADMRRAGINPMLAFDQGGASSPVVGLQNPGRSFSEGVSSAIRYKLERDRIESEVALNKAVGEKASSEVDYNASAAAAQDSASALNMANIAVAKENAATAHAEGSRKYGEIELMGSQAAKLMAETKYINTQRRLSKINSAREGARMERERFFSERWRDVNEMMENMGKTFGGRGSFSSQDLKRRLDEHYGRGERRSFKGWETVETEEE